MSSNNAEHDPAEAQAAGFRSKPKSERTLIERLYLFIYDHRRNRILRVICALGAGLYNITDTRGFMIATHTISSCMVAICLWAAFETGRYACYFTSATLIAGLSFLWPKFTTRALDKWLNAVEEKRKWM